MYCFNIYDVYLVYSQGHCRFSIQPLTILGVTGPFSVLAENIYSLCIGSFNVSAQYRLMEAN